MSSFLRSASRGKTRKLLPGSRKTTPLYLKSYSLNNLLLRSATQQLPGVAAGYLFKEGIRQAQLTEHLEGGRLVGPGGIGTEEEIFGWVREEHIPQPGLIEKVEGKRYFHVDRFTGE